MHFCLRQAAVVLRSARGGACSSMSKRKIDTYFTRRSGSSRMDVESAQNVPAAQKKQAPSENPVQEADDSPVKRQRASSEVPEQTLQQDVVAGAGGSHEMQDAPQDTISDPPQEPPSDAVELPVAAKDAQPASGKTAQAFFQPKHKAKVVQTLDPQQAQEQQQLLAQRLGDVATRNLELAKEVVAAAAAEGRQPQLEDLLIEPSWRQVLGQEFQKPYFKALNSFVQSEWAKPNAKVFPPKEMIFRAFNSCPFEDVRVLVLGQDPYHGPGQAMGLSFSVPPGVPVPSSLANMYKELKTDCACAIPNHGNLEKWSHQGVFMLNAILTVRAAEPASHRNKGWETFTDAAITALAQQRTGIVFMLWGNFAKEKKKLIPVSKHHVLEAAHPSGLSASKGFFGCKHFSKANKALLGDGSVPVDWQIERV